MNLAVILLTHVHILRGCHSKVSCTIVSFKKMNVSPYAICNTGSIPSMAVMQWCLAFYHSPMLLIIRHDSFIWHLSCHHPTLPACWVCNKGEGVMVLVPLCCQSLLISLVLVDLSPGRLFGWYHCWQPRPKMADTFNLGGSNLSCLVTVFPQLPCLTQVSTSVQHMTYISVFGTYISNQVPCIPMSSFSQRFWVYSSTDTCMTCVSCCFPWI